MRRAFWQSCPAFVVAVFTVVLGACSSIQNQWPKAIDPELNPATAARLILPRALQLVGVDGQAYKLPPLQPDPYELLLRPGERELRLVYIDGRYKQGDNDDTLISDTLLIKVTFLTNRVYQVGFNDPSNYEQALAMAESPAFWIDDPVSKHRIHSRPSIPYKSFSLAGLGATSESRKPSSAAVTGDQADFSQPPLDQLKQWWQQASDQQRADFLDWVSEQ